MAPVEAGSATVNGVRLQYEVGGEGPPLLLEIGKLLLPEHMLVAHAPALGLELCL